MDKAKGPDTSEKLLRIAGDFLALLACLIGAFVLGLLVLLVATRS